MPTDRQREIADLVDPVCEACNALIAEAVEANPHLKATAIIMTILDVLTASSIIGLKRAYLPELSLGEIIETHFDHVVDIAAVMEAQHHEEEHNRGQQS